MFDYLKNLLDKKVKSYDDSIENRTRIDLDLISRAFDKIDQNKSQLQELRRLYDSKYTDTKADELKKQNRSNLFVPVTRDCIDAISGQFSAAFFTGRQSIEITGSNKIQVADLNRKLDKMLERSKPTIAFNQAFRSALIYGFACLRITYDKIAGTPRFYAVPIDAFALDHRAINLADSEYYCYRVNMSYEQIKNTFKEPQQTKTQDTYERMEIRQIYHKKTIANDQMSYNYYIARTYLGSELLHEEAIPQLPFFFGYAIPKVPLLITDQYREGIDYFGVGLTDIVKQAQNEINKKRNQKIDADELTMFPKVLYSPGFPVEASYAGAATSHMVEGDLDKCYREMRPSGQVNVERDIEQLKGEMMQSVGVSSINFGITGASDRRSASALEVIEASSGVRVENMIVTICDTLFQHAARGFVDMIRMRGKDPDFAFLDSRFIKVNFGTTTQTEKRQRKLTDLLQIQLQGGNPNPQLVQDINTELAVLLMGNEYDSSKLVNSPLSYGGI